MSLREKAEYQSHRLVDRLLLDEVLVCCDATPMFPRWGRRYPWLIISAVPLGLACTLQWWIPPLPSEGLPVYYTGFSILAFSLFTAVQIPFTALAAELT